MEVVMLKKLPHFMIIGAAKAGTTVLYDYLRQHPEIYFPKVKEPHFFDVDANYIKGLDNYYQEYFSENYKMLIQGEATPSYLRQYERVIPRIKLAYESDSPKFIVVLRDPVERAYSHYLHRRRVHVELETFETALDLENDRLSKDADDWVGYFKDGLYAEQLKAWFRAFPKSQFLIVLNEDLKNNHTLVLRRICEFLGLLQIDFNPKEISSNQHSLPRIPYLMKLMAEEGLIKKIVRKIIRNRSTKERIILFLRRINLKSAPKIQLPSTTINNLRESYKPSICELEDLIGRELSSWK